MHKFDNMNWLMKQSVARNQKLRIYCFVVCIQSTIQESPQLVYLVFNTNSNCLLLAVVSIFLNWC